MTANPNITITRSHVPLWCRLARTVLLGPLTLDDVDAGSFVQPDGAGLGAWVFTKTECNVLGSFVEAVATCVVAV